MATQWRAGPLGPMGLDYAEVRRWAGDMGVALTPAIWRGIRALEARVLEAGHD